MNNKTIWIIVLVILAFVVPWSSLFSTYKLEKDFGPVERVNIDELDIKNVVGAEVVVSGCLTEECIHSGKSSASFLEMNGLIVGDIGFQTCEALNPSKTFDSNLPSGVNYDEQIVLFNIDPSIVEQGTNLRIVSDCAVVEGYYINYLQRVECNTNNDCINVIEGTAGRCENNVCVGFPSIIPETSENRKFEQITVQGQDKRFLTRLDFLLIFLGVGGIILFLIKKYKK